MDLLNQGSCPTAKKRTRGFLNVGSFAECLETRARESPEGLAYVFIDGDGVESEIRNLELWIQAKTLSRKLVSNGLRGNPVILSYPPGLEFIIGFLATVIAGAVAVPIPVLRRKERNERNVSIIRNSEAKWFLSTSEQVGRIRDEGLLAPEIAILATDDRCPSDSEEGWQPPTVDPEQLALVQYTSGSTSDPKGAMLTHRNLIHNSEMIARAMKVRQDDVGLSWLPQYHDMGLVGGILVPLLAGASTTLIGPSSFLRDPLLWLRLISERRVTISGGPDFGYRHCVEKFSEKERSEIDLTSWRVAYVGAEPIRADTLLEFTEKFNSSGFSFDSFFPCYGLAETTLIVTGGPLGSPQIKRFQKSALGQDRALSVDDSSGEATELVASGQALPDEMVKIVNPETSREVEDGSIGEIWIDSPGVASGYFNNPGATKETFGATIKGSGLETPFLRSGDLGFFRDGQLYVTGRLKDLIIIRGVNHYPQDIEYTCELASGFLRKSGIAAFSKEVENREQLVVIAESARGSKPDWESEMARIRSSLASEHELYPTVIQIVSPASLPITPSGKIRRSECRKLFELRSLKVIASWRWDEQEAPQRASNSDSQPADSLMAFLSSAIDRELPHTPSCRLEDLGIDSVERMNLIHAIEQKFSIRIPEESLRGFATVSDVLEETLRRSNGSPVGLDAPVTGDRSQTDRAVPSSHFKIEEFPEVVELKRMRTLLSEAGTGDPYFAIHGGIARETTEIGGREVVNFASYNYLGLSGREEVSEAAVKAVERFGTSSGASRLISGNRVVHEALETTLAEFIGTEAAITFVSGHSTNETVIGHLIGPDDLILFDSLAHNSITQGAKLSGAHRLSFAHNDPESLDRILLELRSQYRRVLIVTEGLFGIDGDVPDLQKFVEIKTKHRCLLMVDEAHSLGTLGLTGRGITEHCGVCPGEVDLIMGTLSKALASCGGLIAGKKELVDYLRYSAPGFVFSVGMPPASAAAARAAIEIIRREPELVSRLHEKNRYFQKKAERETLGVSGRLATSIFSLDLGSPSEALKVSSRLLEKGVNAPPLLYPAVSGNSGKIRFFSCANHTDEQIDFALESLAEILCE